MANPVLTNQAQEEQDDGYDTSDKESVNKARKKAARTRADRLHFVAAAMTTKEGRAWFFDILNRCYVFRSPYKDDPYNTAFRCGELNIGLQLLDDVQTAAPNEYLTMIQENK